MGNKLKMLRSLLQKLDFFPATQFLRYKGQPQYKTATGGFASLIIIIIILVFLSSAGLDMLNKVNVTATSDIQYQMIPSPVDVTFGPGGDFMFAINLIEVDLINPAYTAFDVTLQHERFSDAGPPAFTNIPLEYCTEAHFNYGDDFKTTFVDYGLSKWLCPPLNQKFQIQGKAVSTLYERISLYIQKCDTTLHTDCLTDAQIATYESKRGLFNFYMLVINTQLNPSSNQVYKRYYIEDRNSFQFTTTGMGVLAIPQVQQYKITSDDSVLPFTDPIVEEGLIVTDLFQYYAAPIASDTYLTINFRKSPKVSTYTRTFQKLDQFLAYVGGLIGTVLGVFLIMSSYNQLCYLISLGNKLFCYDQETKIDSDKFNIIYYIRFVGYKIGSFFGCGVTGSPMKIYNDCREELEKQLDVSYLIKRIIFLERALLVLFDEHQLVSLHLHDQMTLDEARELRQKFKIKRKLKKKFTATAHDERYKQTEQGLIQREQIDMVKMPKQYQSQMSASSCETIKSSSVGVLKAKIKTLLSQNQDGSLKNKKIFSNTNSFLLQRLNQQRYRTTNHLQINSFQGVGSFIGDNYFKQMEEKQSIKHKQQMQNYLHKKLEDGL